MKAASKRHHEASATISAAPRRSVGFFRGLVAVVRGTAHAVGTLTGLLGRGLAAVTRRPRRDAGTGTSEG
jgi:hypothetical protein